MRLAKAQMSLYTQSTFKHNMTVSLLPDQIFDTTDTAVCQTVLEKSGTGQKEAVFKFRSDQTPLPVGRHVRRPLTCSCRPWNSPTPATRVYFGNTHSLDTRKSTNKSATLRIRRKNEFYQMMGERAG